MSGPQQVNATPPEAGAETAGPPGEGGRFRIAVLIACHNRREMTLACLDALRNQEPVSGVTTEVYLVDDGSTDGTAGAVRRRYPDVVLFQGDGTLYWCGGMRAAFSEAVKGDYDGYWWLNDDTFLHPRAMRVLLETRRRLLAATGREGIVVGSTCDPDTGELTYGGKVRIRPGNPLACRAFRPADEPLPCDVFNGNCVLVPRAVARELGNLSGEYTHLIGDIDYGLRAAEKGIPCWVAPGYLAVCRGHPTPEWALPGLSLAERLKRLHSPKGPPPREWRIFVRRHGGSRWVLHCAKLYLRALAPRIYDRLKRLSPA